MRSPELRAGLCLPQRQRVERLAFIPVMDRLISCLEGKFQDFVMTWSLCPFSTYMDNNFSKCRETQRLT